MGDDRKRTPPIEEQQFLGGVKVVDIGDLRVARGLSRRPISMCEHHKLVYDSRERRIWCKECETDIEPFDAFLQITERFHAAAAKIERGFKELQEAQDHNIISVAAKEIDKAWRSKRHLPLCPSCKSPLFPEDFRGGCSMTGKELAYAQRKARKGGADG